MGVKEHTQPDVVKITIAKIKVGGVQDTQDRLDRKSVLAGPLIPAPLSLSRGMGARAQGGEALLRGCRMAGCTDVMSGVAGEEVGEYEVMRLEFRIASRKVSYMAVLL